MLSAWILIISQNPCRSAHFRTFPSSDGFYKEDKAKIYNGVTHVLSNYRVNSCFVRLQGNSCFVRLQGNSCFVKLRVNSCFVRVSSRIQYQKYIPIIYTIYTEHNPISQVTLVTSVLIRRSLLFTKQRLDTFLLFTMQRLDTGVDKDFIHILFPRFPLNTEFSSLSSHLVILSHDGTDLNTLKTAVETLYHINQSLSSCITEALQSEEKFGGGTKVAPFQLSDCFSSALLW